MHLIVLNIVWILLECIDYCSTHLSIFTGLVTALQPAAHFLMWKPLLETSGCPDLYQLISCSSQEIWRCFFSPLQFSELESFTVDSSQHFLNYIGIRCHLLELSKKNQVWLSNISLEHDSVILQKDLERPLLTLNFFLLCSPKCKNIVEKSEEMHCR